MTLQGIDDIIRQFNDIINQFDDITSVFCLPPTPADHMSPPKCWVFWPSCCSYWASRYRTDNKSGRLDWTFCGNHRYSTLTITINLTKNHIFKILQLESMSLNVLKYIAYYRKSRQIRTREIRKHGKFTVFSYNICVYVFK